MHNKTKPLFCAHSDPPHHQLQASSIIQLLDTLLEHWRLARKARMCPLRLGRVTTWLAHASSTRARLSEWMLNVLLLDATCLEAQQRLLRTQRMLCQTLLLEHVTKEFTGRRVEL